jgi:hypothetical protein
MYCKGTFQQTLAGLLENIKKGDIDPEKYSRF